MLTVACVYWQGDDPDRTDTRGIYSPEWVRRMRNAVAWATPDARFVCLSNVDVPCERIPLEHEWPGPWSKIELFRPGRFVGPVIYLDLDTVIVRDLWFLSRDRFSMMRDPIPRNGPWSSAAMAWDGDGASAIYETFVADPARWMAAYPKGRKGGKRFLRDQGFIQDALPPAGEPLQVLSYKQDIRGRGLPSDAVAVTFHGRPKQHEVVEPWVAEHWR